MMSEVSLLGRIVSNPSEKKRKDKILALQLEKLQLVSNAVAVTGSSFGDEGKGRIVHELAVMIKKITGSPLDAVFKVNGGANSGHTAAGLKLNLLPSGVADKETKNLILGRGVVADPHKILWESVPLDEMGYNVTKRLVIDDRCMVSDFTHRLLDKGRERWLQKNGAPERGSTGRGISPAFQAETGQTQIYYEVFKGNKDRFVSQMKLNIDQCVMRLRHEYGLDAEDWNGIFEKFSTVELNANNANKHHFDSDEFDFSRFQEKRKAFNPISLNKEALIDSYWEAGQKVVNSIQRSSDLVSKSLRNGKFVVFEFGQAYLLGKRTGFSPNVSASHTYTPEIFSSAGIPLQRVHNVTAAKGYDTKVGTHVFLTQFEDDHPHSDPLKKVEFGTTTGRQRMVGSYDSVEKGHTLKEGGFDEIVFNKIDVLTIEDGKCELRICTGYKQGNGEITMSLPLNDEDRKNAIPVYELLPTWSEDITQIRSFNKLPFNAQVYVSAMYYHTINAAYADRKNINESELPGVRFVGVGPEPGEVISDVPSPSRLINLYLESVKLNRAIFGKN